jgi:hypothetical protein
MRICTGRGEGRGAHVCFSAGNSCATADGRRTWASRALLNGESSYAMNRLLSVNYRVTQKLCLNGRSTNERSANFGWNSYRLYRVRLNARREMFIQFSKFGAERKYFSFRLLKAGFVYIIQSFYCNGCWIRPSFSPTAAEPMLSYDVRGHAFKNIVLYCSVRHSS